MTAVHATACSAPPDRERRLLNEIAVCGGWALSTYGRCEFRCVYCITAAQGASTPILSREELPDQLRQELASIDPAMRIAVGAICDAYPPVEKDHGVTRRALEVLIDDGRDIGVITKGTHVLRDADVLREAKARVTISLCTVDERALKRLDPRAPTAAERLSAITALADSGVDVSVSAAPWIPGASDVEALRARVPPGVLVTVAPLNVLSPEVAATPYGRRFSQRAVNEAYLDEFARVGPRPRLDWLQPIRVDESEPEHRLFARLKTCRPRSTKQAERSGQDPAGKRSPTSSSERAHSAPARSGSTA